MGAADKLQRMFPGGRVSTDKGKDSVMSCVSRRGNGGDGAVRGGG